jgi:undecaprenyl pyrophosphate phosphatase UppP
MVYLFGILGFIGGFMAGLIVINIFLQNVSRDKLLGDKSLRWTYGLAVWVIAGIGVYAGLWVHARYFAG